MRILSEDHEKKMRILFRNHDKKLLKNRNFIKKSQKTENCIKRLWKICVFSTVLWWYLHLFSIILTKFVLLVCYTLMTFAYFQCSFEKACIFSAVIWQNLLFLGSHLTKFLFFPWSFDKICIFWYFDKLYILSMTPWQNLKLFF